MRKKCITVLRYKFGSVYFYTEQHCDSFHLSLNNSNIYIKATGTYLRLLCFSPLGRPLEFPDEPLEQNDACSFWSSFPCLPPVHYLQLFSEEDLFHISLRLPTTIICVISHESCEIFHIFKHLHKVVSSSQDSPSTVLRHTQ